ncbi:hypothetical protein FY136_06040 [Agrobacterium tumefaciens]|nr:hypothetical protein FY136_06040 [Agrobacterium tumefaciens]
MKPSDEFLNSLPLLPSCDFNSVEQAGTYRVEGQYLNSPITDEMDGSVSISSLFGDPYRKQEVTYEDKVWQRRRIGDEPFGDWVPLRSLS